MVPNDPHFHKKSIFQGMQLFAITLILLFSPVPVLASGNLIGHSGLAIQDDPVLWGDNETTLPDFKSFLESVENGQKGVLRGVFVPGVLAIPVVQQPVGYPGYVSQNDDEITEFSMAAEVGNVGLLAHNDLSGAQFTKLSSGQEVRLIFGDGNVEYFSVSQILQYQALQPYSPNSEFRDLETGVTISAEELFRKVYRGERHVTFQTCIEANGIGSWGRLFVIAEPKLFPYIEQEYIRDNLLPNIP
jgi:hypothetical protein